MTPWRLLEVLAYAAQNCWCMSGCIITIDNMCGHRLAERGRAIARSLYLEIKPFYLYLIPLQYLLIALRRDVDVLDAVGAVLSVWNWLLFKDLDDDDRWKRRREKLRAKVEVVGGRLVVAPATGD